MEEQYKDLLQRINSGNFDFNDFKLFIQGVAEMDSTSLEQFRGELGSVYEKLLSNPDIANYQKRRQTASLVEGGLEALRSISNIAIARGQQNEARRLANELQEPTAPPIQPKSEELAAATEQARRDRYAPLRDVNPILDANMRMLNEGMQQARVASGGQASVYGAMGQAAVNRAREANVAMIPQIERIRRAQQAEYNRLIQAGVSEDSDRFRQAMDRFRIEENRYLTEAQAIGAMGSSANQNMYNTTQNLFDQMGQLVDPVMGAFNSTSGATNPYATGGTNVANGNLIGQNTQFIYNPLTNLDPDIGGYASKIDQNLFDREAGLNTN